MKLTGQFKRPSFTVPAIPEPPAMFGALQSLAGAVVALVSVAVKLPSISLNPRGAVDPALAALKSQKTVAAQNLLKAKAAAISLPAMLPDGLPDIGTVTQQALAYQQAMQGIRAQVFTNVDEFGKALQPPIPPMDSLLEELDGI